MNLMSTKREMGENWTVEDNISLVELIAANLEIVENKAQGGRILKQRCKYGNP